jgi:ABC-2 type transport system permease protein
VEADATDPIATGNTLAALNRLRVNNLARDLPGGLLFPKDTDPPIDLRIHRRYNPDAITARVGPNGLGSCCP